MVQRDRTYEYPFCVKTAKETCLKCHLWLCSGSDTPDHLKSHVCKTTATWVEAAPALNQVLEPRADAFKKRDKEWQEKWR